jgi:hypothetical protein
MAGLLSRVAFVVLSVSAAAQKDDPAGLPTELGKSYGFTGLHVSRFSGGLRGLVSGDLDGDGQPDLAVINNGRSRIELLLRRKPGEPASDEAAPDADKVNELVDEDFFRRESFAVEEKVEALELADMDGDGRCELLFTGDSGKLTVAWHAARGGTARSLRLRLPDEGKLVRAGDLDGDGRTDALVCGTSQLWIFRQRESGDFGEPDAVPLATSSPDDVLLRDLDGDKRLDLLVVKAESEWPLRWRLGLAEGRFGEERSARFAAIRAWAVGDVDGDGRTDVAAVRRQSGRITLLRWRQPDAAAEGTLALDAPDVLPFEKLKDSERRDVVVMDLDGDGTSDVVAAEPSAARVLWWRGGAGAPRVVPSLLGAHEPRLLVAAGRRALVVAAPDEGAIGVAALGADGTPAFPKALPLPAVGEGADAGSPELLTLDVAPLAEGQPDAIWAVVAAGKGRTRAGALVRLDADGKVLDSFKLENLKTDPRGLLVADLDRDGRRDALLCLPTELPRILLAQAAGGFKDVNVAQSPGLGLLKGLERDALWWGDVDGDGSSELLVPGPNFARAFALDAAGVPVVVGQFNLPDPGAQVACVAAADLDHDGKPEVVLADRAQKSLDVAGRADAPGLRARVDLGELQPRALAVATGTPSRLVLLAADRFGVLGAGASRATFLPDLDFEVPVKDAYVNDIAIGDINGDGTPDLVMTETLKHQLVIARARAQVIDFALRFPVYEERLFESGRSGQEPRQVVLAELTGDGLLDVAILVHDRLVVYPQEAAP